MPYQTVLVMSTKGPELRSEAIGWTLNSGLMAHQEIERRRNWDFHVGMIGAPRQGYCFPTVLHALGMGYKLLAPPIAAPWTSELSNEYEWWLVKDEP